MKVDKKRREAEESFLKLSHSQRQEVMHQDKFTYDICFGMVLNLIIVCRVEVISVSSSCQVSDN